jgi:hypothetical protein
METKEVQSTCFLVLLKIYNSIHSPFGSPLKKPIDGDLMPEKLLETEGRQLQKCTSYSTGEMM